MESRIRELSETLSKRKEAPASRVHLRRRMERDHDTFLKALRAEGYYSATVESDIAQAPEGSMVTFTFNPGPRYTLSAISIEPKTPPPSNVLPAPKEIGLDTGAPARAQTVLDAENKLLNLLRNRGYPFPKVDQREVTVDYATHTMDVRFALDLGPRADFGQLRVKGLDKVKERVVKSETPWESGDRFEARELELYRKRLYDTGLFSIVRVKPDEEVSPGGDVPIDLEVVERKHRTIAVGLDYYTDEGAGSRFKWEHRNLWGLGRRLTWETRIAQIRQESKLTLSLERFRRRDQRLVLSLEGGRFAPDAFTSRRVRTSAILERKLTDHLSASGGVALRYSRVEQLGETDSFEFVSFPLELRWDRSNSALDPTKGFRLSGHVEPFLDFFGQPSRFVKSEVTGSYYLPFDKKRKWVLATRAKAGSIAGESRNGVPADERFYAGGGGSIRGYPFQEVGPIEDGEPIGGLSLVEVSAEMRFRATEQFGLVAFVDGGSVFGSSLPNFDEPLRYGAGVGVRYFSPIGPFRLDVAFPLNKPDNVNDSFQIYVSIGQAF